MPSPPPHNHHKKGSGKARTLFQIIVHFMCTAYVIFRTFWQYLQLIGLIINQCVISLSVCVCMCVLVKYYYIYITVLHMLQGASGTLDDVCWPQPSTSRSYKTSWRCSTSRVPGWSTSWRTRQTVTSSISSPWSLCVLSTLFVVSLLGCHEFKFALINALP